MIFLQQSTRKSGLNFQVLNSPSLQTTKRRAQKLISILKLKGEQCRATRFFLVHKCLPRMKTPNRKVRERKFSVGRQKICGRYVSNVSCQHHVRTSKAVNDFVFFAFNLNLGKSCLLNINQIKLKTSSEKDFWKNVQTYMIQIFWGMFPWFFFPRPSILMLFLWNVKKCWPRRERWFMMCAMSREVFSLPSSGGKLEETLNEIFVLRGWWWNNKMKIYASQWEI